MLLVTSNITWKQGLAVEVVFPVVLMGEIASSRAATPSNATGTAAAAAVAAPSLLNMDLGGMRGALLLPPGSQEGQLTVQYLLLTGLAQGPEAVAARSLRDARVWTLCLWNIARWVGGLGMRGGGGVLPWHVQCTAMACAGVVSVTQASPSISMRPLSGRA